ncbi:MAG: hypothetical protein AAFR07_16010 [Pseudomonadota bacterium]
MLRGGAWKLALAAPARDGQNRSAVEQRNLPLVHAVRSAQRANAGPSLAAAAPPSASPVVAVSGDACGRVQHRRARGVAVLETPIVDEPKRVVVERKLQLMPYVLAVPPRSTASGWRM